MRVRVTGSLYPRPHPPTLALRFEFLLKDFPFNSFKKPRICLFTGLSLAFSDDRKNRSSNRLTFYIQDIHVELKAFCGKKMEPLVS